MTGRKRRCGWFDAVLVRQTIITGGVDGIALTKLDVLDGLKCRSSAIATHYESGGQKNSITFDTADANLQA